MKFKKVGIYFCFKNLTEANIFIVLYGMTSIYFAVIITFQSIILIRLYYNSIN